MSHRMDFTKLRAAALKDGDDEEAVTVNTRALIDKVLARYSGEWTTLRELIQNAADAQATKVSIKFETLPSAHVPLSNTTSPSEVLKHVLLHHTLRRLLVSNNGQAFGANDWSRLKRIAEGNPDETKIGAFGVGFYSVFADCEEPFVSSGNEAMAFYWKGNSLFTRRLQLPAAEGNPDTSFVLDYRNTTTPMPNLLSIAQFLATSLTFVALDCLELWVDDWKIITLQKKAAPSVRMPLAYDVETKTKEGMMQILKMDQESVQMDATFMNVVGWKPTVSTSVSRGFDQGYGNSSNDSSSLRSFFSRLTASTQGINKTKAMKEEQDFQEIVLEDLTKKTTANVFLRVTTAGVKTFFTSQFAAELERATKKPPPKTTTLAILTSSYDETTASVESNPVAKRVDIFASVLPSKKPGGRIFIGFPTHQTTGAGMHLSAPSVIPTVERESIDLNARWVRTWNQEVLRVAGIMSRLAFSNEMADLSTKVKRASELAGNGPNATKDVIAQLMPEALHILETFTFGESTPSSQVAHIIMEAFWTAYKKPSIEIFSTRGVLPTTKVRLATEDLSGFVDSIPVVPDAVAKSAFVTMLKSYGLIEDITIGDIRQELSAKALTSEQLKQLVAWAGKKASGGQLDRATIRSMLDVVVATSGEVDGQGDIITLGSVANFLSINKVPADVPLPPTTIPFAFTIAVPTVDLEALGWVALDVLSWIRFLIETESSRRSGLSVTRDPVFAAKALLVLSKSWDSLSPQARISVISLLQGITIIPTKLGMRTPGQAFFQSVKLFDDLPIIKDCPGVKEKFLGALGVRKTVDLETIFERLLSPSPNSKDGEVSSKPRHVELIKYLASVKDDIPSADMKRLKESRICPAEAGPTGREQETITAKLYRVSELFVPLDGLRRLNLPILQWPGPPGSLRANSAEGKFLYSLGLRDKPTVPELIDMMASADGQLRNKSMIYFVSQYEINGYAHFNVGSSAKRFLPLDGNEDQLVSPAECFTNASSSIFGFNVLTTRLHAHATKFGVGVHPPMAECVNRLIVRPPQSKRDAVALFAYFATRLAEIGGSSIAKLGDAKIVPIAGQRNSPNDPIDAKVSTGSRIRHVTPRQCYLGNSNEYEEIFDYVDFGVEANSFLQKCGCKHEPTTIEIATLAIREPARLLGTMQTPEKYISMLRSLANELPTLRRDRELFKQMKSAKWLMGSVEVSAKKQSHKPNGFGGDGYGSDEEEEASIKHWQLVAPNQAVDDYASYRLFKASLICAPLEEKIEDFYQALGASNLGSLVEEKVRLGSASDKQDSAVKLKSHILERSKLFLHDHAKDGLKNDARWLEKNLVIQVVSSISLRRALRGHTFSHTEKRAAHIEIERRNGCILYVLAGKDVDSYQVSQCICKVLIERPNQQSFLTFESFLNLSLYQLRSRGYNVERILRQKAAEQRVAEEERKKQLEIEQRNIREQEALWRQQQAQLGMSPVPTTAREAPPKTPAVPGAYGSADSSPASDHSRPDTPPSHELEVPKSKPRGLFSGLKNRLGLNESDDVQQQLQNFLGGGSNRHPGESRKDGLPAYDDVTKPPKPTTEQVSSPHATQQNLMNAIQSSRAHGSSSLFSPPTTKTVKEQSSYCDSTPATNITFLADSSNGTRIFASKDLTTPATLFLTENSTALNSFALLLHEVAEVYNLPKIALHIFYDESGGTIAFNYNGSIFANFRFFAQLHQRNMTGEGKVEAVSYWWIVCAHELAHNIIKEHNSEHSYYTESFVAKYFPKMMAKAAGYLQANHQQLGEASLLD